MRIVEASIRGFGRLVERNFRFASGAQILVGDNEAGKSTLQKFILAMLFGLKREDRRRREYMPDYDLYKPWSGAPYAGRLVYELADGGRFEVFRVFERKEESLRIVDAVSGRDLTAEFPLDARKERPLMQRQLQLSRQLFEATTSVGQLAGRPSFEGVGELRARIQGLLDSGDETMSAQAALAALQQLRERLGSERTPTRGAGLLLQQRRMLQNELEGARTRHGEILDLHRRGAEVGLAYAQHEAAWRARRRAELERERAQLLRRVQRLATLATSVEELQGRLESYADVADVDVAAYAPARERGAAIAALAASVQARRHKRDLRLQREGELQRFEARLAAALGGMDRPRAQDLERQAERLRERIGRVREARSRHGEEQRRNRAIVDTLLQHHGKDWTRDDFLGQLARERARAASDEPARLRAQADGAARRYGATRRRVALLAVLVALVVSGSAAHVWLDPWVWPWGVRLAAAGFAVGLAAVAAFWLLRRLLAVRDQARTLASRAEDAENAARSAAAWLDEVLRRNALDDLEEFEGARREYETLRAQAERISAGTGRELQQSEAELAALAETLQRQVRSCDLAALEAMFAPEPVPVPPPYTEEENAADMDPDDPPELRRLLEDLSLLPRLRHAFAWLERVREERATLQQQSALEEEELREREERLAGERAGLEAILRQNGAPDLAHFADRVARHREREALLATIQPLLREQEGVLGGEQAASLRARVTALETAAASDASAANAVATVPLATDDSLEALGLRRDRLAAEQAQLAERLAARESEARLPAEVELELQEVEARLAAARQREAALDLATATLERVATSMHREAAPRMNERVGQIFARLSRGMHAQVRLDEDLTPRIRRDADGLVGVESLSGGAADQLYFALRVTAGELLSRQGELLPLLLDDPFVQYDPERLQAALELVAELAREHQVLFFTYDAAQARTLAAHLVLQNVPHDSLHL